MSVEWVKTYLVEISLGWNVNNIVFRCNFLGEPTKEKLLAVLDHVISLMHPKVDLVSGLPAKQCLVYHQCCYLVNNFGIPDLGLGMPCKLSPPWVPNTIGHISIVKTGSVVKTP